MRVHRDRARQVTARASGGLPRPRRSRWARRGQGEHTEVKVSANTEARHGVEQTPSSGTSNHAFRPLSVSPCCHLVTCHPGALTGLAYPTPSPKGRTRSPPTPAKEWSLWGTPGLLEAGPVHSWPERGHSGLRRDPGESPQQRVRPGGTPLHCSATEELFPKNLEFVLSELFGKRSRHKNQIPHKGTL